MSLSNEISREDEMFKALSEVSLEANSGRKLGKTGGPVYDAGPNGDGKASSQHLNGEAENEVHRVEEAKEGVNPHPINPEEEESDDTGAEDDESDEESSSDDDIKAPIELMGEFVGCIRSADWENAAKLCKMILIYEPDNPEALQFQPLIEEKMQVEKELAEMSSSSEEEDSSEEDSDEDEEDAPKEDDQEEEDDDNDGPVEFEERPGSTMKNRLIFPHKEPVWKP